MLGSAVELELFEHMPSDFIFGQHSLHGQTQDFFGPAFEQLRRGLHLSSTRITGIVIVLFGHHFRREIRVRRMGHPATAEADFLGIDDDDEIARIDVGRINRLMLAHENRGKLHR